MNDLNSMLQIHCCCYEKNIYPWHQPSLHTPFWRFYWNPLSGGILRLSGQTIRMTPEYFYIIPGYLHFSTIAENVFEQFYIHFNLSDRQQNISKVLTLRSDPETVNVINAFIQRGSGIKNQQLTMFTAVNVLSSVLLRLPPEIFQLPPHGDLRIVKIQQLISENPAVKATNEEFARMTGMSRSGFIRLFEQQVGEPPQHYLNKKRIERACQLLHLSNLSLDEIAEKTGFANRYHFSRVFNSIIKISPAKFRKML